MDTIWNILIILLASFAFLFLTLRVIPFGYYMITGFLAIRKIEKKVENISLEYHSFAVRKEHAEKQGIEYTAPFSLTYEIENLVIKTDFLSQAEYYGSLKQLESELDTLIANTSNLLIENSPLNEYIDMFKTIKLGILEANPYQ